ncbi:4a-hydroxytetrahydrobiopterin dehydratase [Asticcacaulis solisilvae]|uniref:4a-hydroxytetrahydrobiopterin dehydratase n=1 Tax=Asticcacaulis solisilvae TaxID=1217274 RepID=UPI003FD82B52
MPKLSSEQLDDAQRDLPLWRVDKDALFRDLVFADFKHAFAFMTEVAAEADRADHHPDWSNVYDKVSVLLSTHDAGGVTEKDVALARFVDGAAQRNDVK